MSSSGFPQLFLDAGEHGVRALATGLPEQALGLSPPFELHLGTVVPQFASMVVMYVASYEVVFW